MFVKIYPSSVAFLLAATLLVSPLHADTVISTDTTQDGGTLPVDPPILAVTSDTTTPVLTLTNSATASFTGATVVGALLEESGILRILNGSTMTVSGDGTPIRSYGSLSVYYGDGILGLNGDAQGTALVSGTGSVWTMRHLAVGAMGNGNLTVENGGTVENQFATVGDTGQGEVTVTGANSTWDIQENLIVGRQGGGTLHVTGSGIVSSKNAHIGSDAGSSGFVEITGSDSAWTGRAISVGFEGTGNLQIENGGRLNNTDSYLGRAAGGQGTATVSGADSLWKMSGGLTIGGTNSTSGELTVEDGGTVQVMGALLLHENGSLVIGTDATLDVGFDIQSAGSILLHDGTLTVQSVLIQSGGSIGAMGSFSLVDGDLILASGASIQFSLTSTLSVSGSVTLDSSFGIASLTGLDQSTPIGSYTIFGEVIEGTHTDYAALGIQNWGIENAYDLGGGKAAYFRQGSLVLEVIPEPGTGVLFLTGLGAGLLVRRRRRK